MEWDGEEALVPAIPFEYKFYKVVLFFGIDKDKDLSLEEVDVLYEKMRLLAALDNMEFPRGIL